MQLSAAGYHLSDASPRMRCRAVRAIARHCDLVRMPRIAHLARYDPDLRVRVEAITSMRTMPRELLASYVTLLVDAISPNEYDVARTARVQHWARSVRAAAMCTIQRIDHTVLALYSAEFAKMAQDADDGLRAAAVYTLSLLDVSALESHVDVLMDACLDESSRVRVSAYVALAVVDPQTGVVGALCDGVVAVRKRILSWLAMKARDDIVPHIGAIVHCAQADKVWMVRVSALLLLAALPTEYVCVEVQGAAMQAITRHAAPERAAGLRILGRLDAEDRAAYADTIGACAVDGHPTVRTEAICAFTGLEHGGPVYVIGLDDTHSNVRIATMRALLNASSEERDQCAERVAECAKHDAQVGVRAMAYAVLAMLDTNAFAPHAAVVARGRRHDECMRVRTAARQASIVSVYKVRSAVATHAYSAVGDDDTAKWLERLSDVPVTLATTKAEVAQAERIVARIYAPKGVVAQSLKRSFTNMMESDS